jgi:cytochrome c
MEFFDKIVLPQSAEHIQLLHYLMVLIQFLFLSFISLVLVGTFLSLRYWKKGLKEKNHLYIQFSKDLIDTLTVNKSFGVVLGILPIITSILIYAQLLHKSNSSAMIILLIAFPLIAFGLILVYTFRYSLTFTDLFNILKSGSSLGETLKSRVEKFESGSNNLARKSGIGGLALLAVGTWYYISAISFAVFSEVWGNSNQLTVLFSMTAILNFIQFLLFAFAITGSTILFAFFYWEGGKENLTEEYKKFVKKTSLTITFTALILLPLMLLINVFILPKSSLSGSVFTYTVIAVALIFLSYHLLYAISKTSNLKMGGQLFFAVIFTFLALIIKDQMAMSNSTKLHSAILSSDFDKYLSELKGEGTATVKVRSGEELFTIVCSSCHKFDERLVGPQYNKVLTKYEGKMDQLVAFIRNPVKVDPAYPPMPNQGLRAEEAKNIAQYLMDQHSKSAAPK